MFEQYEVDWKLIAIILTVIVVIFGSMAALNSKQKTDCNDSLETKEIWRPDKEYGKIIDHFEYYCFGCPTELKGQLKIGDFS